MNQIEFKKGIRGFKNIKLTQSERKNVYNSIVGEPLVSPYQSWLSTYTFYITRTAALAALVVVVFVGVSFGAESSLPGDKLYSFKVGFNEKVQSALQVSPVAKAEWEQAKSVERLDEALELAVQNKLTPEVRQEIESRFEKHAESFEDSLGKIASTSKSATLIEIKFEDEIASKIQAIDDFESSQSETNNDDQPEIKNFKAVPEQAMMMSVSSENFAEKKSKKDESELQKLKRKVEERLVKRQYEERDIKSQKENKGRRD